MALAEERFIDGDQGGEHRKPSKLWRRRHSGEIVGPSAVDQACERLRELCAEGNIEGCREWAGILAAMNELQRVEHREGCVPSAVDSRGRTASAPIEHDSAMMRNPVDNRTVWHQIPLR